MSEKEPQNARQQRPLGNAFLEFTLVAGRGRALRWAKNEPARDIR